METGSLVKCVVSFELLRKQWGFDYPKMGDILTVSQVIEHPNKECRDAGIVCLRFVEKPRLCDVSDRQINGNHNFIELLPHIDLVEELGALGEKVSNVLYQQPT